MLRWLRRDHDHTAQVPGGVAVATQQANRAHDRERGAAPAPATPRRLAGSQRPSRPAVSAGRADLAWRRRATGLAIEADRPSYVLEALGPVPESTRGRRAWRPPAAAIEHYRRSYRITDPDRALGPVPHHPTQRAARQRARTAIERVQAKQRSTDPTRDAQSTSEPTSQPRSREQRGWPGPERAAG
jgi:hypothetical protein